MKKTLFIIFALLIVCLIHAAPTKTPTLTPTPVATYTATATPTKIDPGTYSLTGKNIPPPVQTKVVTMLKNYVPGCCDELTFTQFIDRPYAYLYLWGLYPLIPEEFFIAYPELDDRAKVIAARSK